jgi:murein DD-endopeptidase MepM/ murein hydrolase activator NlpD
MKCSHAARDVVVDWVCVRALVCFHIAIALPTTISCATTSTSERVLAPAEPSVDDDGPVPPPAGDFYTVKAGDTLYGIATRHQVSVEDVAEVNGLEHADQLAVGQVLFIPDDGLALPTETPQVVVVEPEPSAPSASTSVLMWPLDEGVILRDFDRARAQDGIVLAAPQGTPVLASADGEVIFVGDEGKTYGRMVMIRHADNILTIYAHLDRIDVEKGARVRTRDAIGTVGETGRTESPQLHFQVRRGREVENPLSHLPTPE